MHCSKAVRHIQLYIDRQLTLEQIRALEAHLSRCLACRQALFSLERIEQVLRGIEPVAEPTDLTTNIMRRVAMSPQRSEKPAFILFRPSFSELVAAMFLATIATLGVVLGQPSLRAILPFDGELSALLNNAWATVNVNNGALMLSFWVVGTVLGVWITLMVAGAEMRSQWLKAVIDRLPVW